MKIKTYSSQKRLDNAFGAHTENTISNELLLMWMKIKDTDTVGISAKEENTLIVKQDARMCLKFIQVSFEQIEFIRNNLFNQYITQYPIWTYSQFMEVERNV